MTDPQRPAPLVCQEVVELITDYLEGALDSEQVAALEAHLSLCGPCRDYVEQMRQTIAVMGRVPTETLTDDAKADLLAAFRGYRGPGPRGQ
jgi:predicted anti-sigma-YlaC factor YlaD